jgi:predicted dehydrogenase
VSTTGVGIIGCGWVAQEHIKAFQNDERSQVHALVSRNPANAAHFLDCITDDTTPFPDLEDAAKTHNVCFAADMSAEQGKAVMLADLES